MLRRWLQDDRGATAIEYALVATLLALTAITGLSLVRDATKSNWDTVSEAVGKATGS